LTSSAPPGTSSTSSRRAPTGRRGSTPQESTDTWLWTRSVTYGLDEPQIEHVLDGYRLTGLGYADHPPGVDYGFSLTAPSWVCRRLEERTNLGVVGYEEIAWNRHQDVVGCVRETS
jgi:hypothetical protein